MEYHEARVCGRFGSLRREARRANEVLTLNDMAKNLILWVVIAIVLISVFNSFGHPQIATKQVAYSDFIEQVRQGQVSEVMIEGRTIQGNCFGGEEFITYCPGV